MRCDQSVCCLLLYPLLTARIHEHDSNLSFDSTGLGRSECMWLKGAAGATRAEFLLERLQECLIVRVVVGIGVGLVSTLVGQRRKIRLPGLFKFPCHGNN